MIGYTARIVESSETKTRRPRCPKRSEMASSTTAGLILFLSLLLAPESPRGPVETVTLKGTVVELTEALKPTGLAVDAEPIARQVVVRDPEGAITPLLSDEASRALFLDERLRDRPVGNPGASPSGPPVRPGGHVQGRRRRSDADAGVLLRDLHHQRPLPADLPLLPGGDGTPHEAGAPLGAVRSGRGDAAHPPALPLPSPHPWRLESPRRNRELACSTPTSCWDWSPPSP